MSAMKNIMRLWVFLAFALAAPEAFAQACPQQTINAQTGTTYTVLNSDNCKKVSLSNGSAVAVTLPQAGSNSNFGATWTATFINIGAGAVTITPTTSTIDGLSSRVLNQYQGIRITSNGTNYVSDGISVTGTTASTVAAGNDSRFTSGLASGVSIPVCPNGTGCLTTATPDIYPLPMAVAIPNSTTPYVICKASPAGSVTVLIKKWTAGNPASSSTLGTFTVSTACAISGSAISATSFNAGDGISAEATEASTDATAIISVAVPFNKQ